MMADIPNQAEGFSSALGSDMVEIFVGPEKKRSYVHKSILCARVPYFQKMFCGSFIESDQKSATLPEEDPAVFDLFLEWVYGKGRLEPLDISKITPEAGPFVDRIKLYGFAERICLGELMDYLLTNMESNFQHYKKSPRMSSIKLAYQETRPKSPLRAYFSRRVALFLKETSREDGPWNAEELAQHLMGEEDILRDVIKVIRKQETILGTRDLPFTNVCKFHSHAEGAECAFMGQIL